MQKDLKALFFNAKSGDSTCTVNDILLHSRYDPVREASVFCDNLSYDFAPMFVVMAEPALSYSAQFLRQKFPNAKLCCIRYSHDFDNYNALWDYVLFCDNEESLCENLFNLLGEDGIALSLFLSWQPCQKAFMTQALITKNAIKDSIKKATAVMATRKQFSPLWLKNAFAFCSYLTHPIIVKNDIALSKSTQDIIITASGPSLENVLPFIKSVANNVFVIALSSSVKVLLNYGINPNLVMSTDGGFWARKHIANLPTSFSLALTAEAATSYSILEQNPILPLTYNDSLEAKLQAVCGFAPVQVKRNGTVSGTALSLAQKLTSGCIYFCGLDMCATNGLSHARGNFLESERETKETRLWTHETRLFAQGLESYALDLYAAWFSCLDKNTCSKVFRLSSIPYKNKLGNICDIKPQDIVINKGEHLRFSDMIMPIPKEKRKYILRDFLAQKQNKMLLEKEIFPALKLREFKTGKAELTAEEKKEMQGFLTKIARIISD